MIFNILLTVAELGLISYITYYFMSHIRRTIFLKKYTYWIAFVLYTLAVGSGMFTRNDKITIALVMVVGISIGHFMFNKSYQYFFYYVMMLAEICFCQTALNFGISAFLQTLQIEPSTLMLNLIVCFKIVIEVGMVWILTHFVRNNELKSVTRWQSIGLLILPVFSIIFLFTLFEVGFVYLQLYGIKLMFINTILLFILNIYFVNMSVYMSKSNELDKELKLYHRQNQLQYNYYAELERRYQDSRKVIHDMKNHLHAVERLYDVKESDAGNEYVNDMYHMLNILGEKYYTDNRMLNIILNDKLQRPEREGIEVSVQIAEVGLGFMKDIDVTAIFANLLDNAIEAAGKSGEHGYIRIKMDYFNEFIVCSIRNSLPVKPELISTNPVRKEKLIGEDKKNKHMGFGLQNVRNTLEKYAGTMQIDKTGKEFQVNITLPKSEK